MSTVPVTAKRDPDERPAATLSGGVEPQRTDPRSFAVRAVSLLSQLAIPIIIASMTILDDGEIGDLILYFLPLVLIVIAANIAFAYAAWWRLTYAVGETDIRVESGIISRAARSVPYERIQDVSLEQKLIPRLFGLVEVKFETGAGGGEDLKLAYLSDAEGERLRELVRARKSGLSIEAGSECAEATEEEGPPIFAMDTKRIVTFGLFEFSLAVVAVVAGAAQQFDFLLPFDIWDFDAWEERLAGPEAYFSGLGPWAQAIGVAFAIASLALVGVVTGLVRTLLREWGFTLQRTDKGFRRKRGLLTRTDVVMPAHRVQALKFGTRFIRRRFGWHGLKFVSLAQDAGASSHAVAPFAQWEELEPISRAAGFSPPTEELDWHRASKEYRVDRSLLALLFILPISLGVANLAHFTDFEYVPLLALAGIVMVAALAARPFFLWRFERHAIDERQVYSRRGWLAPNTDVASRIKLQSVEIAQGPIARWRGYATLNLGLAGGSFAIPGLPLEHARELRAAILESISHRDFSELI